MAFIPSVRPVLQLASAAIALLVVFSTSACSDEVVSVVPVASVGIQPADLSLQEGESATLSAVLRGSGGETLSGRTVAWSSDAEEIAEVDAAGRVMAGRQGQTTVRLLSEGVEGTATVTVLGRPTIHASESRLTFEGFAGQGGSMEREVLITNSQGGVLSGLTLASERHDAPATEWLQSTLLGTTAPTSAFVTVRILNLLPGTYTGVVRLQSEVAQNSPFVIEVELVVLEPPPELRLDPASLALNGVTGDVEPASLTVGVENTGGGTIGTLNSTVRYPDGEPEGWLEARLESDAAPTSMVVRASPRLLAPGTYRGIVDVSSPDALNDFDSVEVVFTVSPRASGVTASNGGVRDAAVRQMGP